MWVSTYSDENIRTNFSLKITDLEDRLARTRESLASTLDKWQGKRSSLLDSIEFMDAVVNFEGKTKEELEDKFKVPPLLPTLSIRQLLAEVAGVPEQNTIFRTGAPPQDAEPNRSFRKSVPHPLPAFGTPALSTQATTNPSNQATTNPSNQATANPSNPFGAQTSTPSFGSSATFGSASTPTSSPATGFGNPSTFGSATPAPTSPPPHSTTASPFNNATTTTESIWTQQATQSPNTTTTQNVGFTWTSSAVPPRK